MAVLLMQAERTGKLPSTLTHMPALDPGNEVYFEAFEALHASRNMNGVIPLSEIAAWLDLVGERDTDERDRTARLIRAMDDEYLAWREKTRGRD